MRYAFGRPCGNLNNRLMRRPVSIPSIYAEFSDSCNYEKDGNREHELFEFTNFKL
jgi:hypothetical protein